MALNEGDIVYISNNGIIEQCKIAIKDFGHDGTYLLHSMNSKNGFIAEAGEMYSSPDECMQETARKNKEKYELYYSSFDSLEVIILHSLYAGVTGEKFDELELIALVNRASEFTNADVAKALEEYKTAMEKEKEQVERKKV